MKNRSLLRFVSVLLCVQPVFWLSRPALAQSLQQLQQLQQAQQAGSAAPSITTPVGLGDTEVMSPERPLVSPAPAVQPAVDESIDPDKYVCGNGDVLELNFWGVQNFKLR